MAPTKGEVLREKLTNFCRIALELWPEVADTPAAKGFEMIPSVATGVLVEFVHKKIIPYENEIKQRDWMLIDAALEKFQCGDISVEKLSEADREKVALYLECFCVMAQ